MAAPSTRDLTHGAIAPTLLVSWPRRVEGTTRAGVAFNFLLTGALIAPLLLILVFALWASACPSPSCCSRRWARTRSG
ncbi:hypothetical protein GCM10011394_18450 [Luteimonas terricola]|uniref:Uncharacterized protein n=1 Tax=Luteimonas terricola TaxID=645597 RepID=A0ABQ2EI82_9GAMM|nr:hypothetical protein GCM10011394_18450 [Luteimonas terricola]